MEIFKHLRPPEKNPWIDPVYRREFSRIALVCRFFCSVMLPWIFESMEFATSVSRDLKLAPFCRSIISGCGSARIMATYVKRCSFSDWIQDQNDSTPCWYNLEFQTLYSRALAFMPNVEELKLTKITINRKLLKRIVELKCLTSLSLNFCDFGEIKAKDICKLSTLQLKHLRFTGSSLAWITLIENTLLVSQFLCLDSLLTVHTNYWPFVARIAEQNSHLPLQELEILEILEAENLDMLPKVFQKTPALKKLRITSTPAPNHDVQFDDVLPALRELYCPLFLLRSLVPGRPISSIEITTSSWAVISDIQSFFKINSALNIRSLCVPIYVYLRIPFWERFPGLKSLRLESNNYLDPFNEQVLNLVFSKVIFTSSRILIHMYRYFQISVTPGLTTRQYKNYAWSLTSPYSISKLNAKYFQQ